MRGTFLFIASLLLCAADGPDQPVPFSHKQHIALKLQCKDCHTMPEPGEMMTFPAEAKCMACHTAVKKESPHIQKLASHAERKQPVPWVRVYQIPTYVFWSHKSHLNAGAKCESCHGQVSERDKLVKEGDISMGACMNCHRMNKASNDCNYCHMLQP